MNNLRWVGRAGEEKQECYVAVATSLYLFRGGYYRYVLHEAFGLSHSVKQKRYEDSQTTRASPPGYESFFVLFLSIFVGHTGTQQSTVLFSSPSQCRVIPTYHAVFFGIFAFVSSFDATIKLSSFITWVLPYGPAFFLHFLFPIISVF